MLWIYTNMYIRLYIQYVMGIYVCMLRMCMYVCVCTVRIYSMCMCVCMYSMYRMYVQYVSYVCVCMYDTSIKQYVHTCA